MFAKTYKGDLFKNLMRAYSYDRMSRDTDYKRAVYQAIEQRKMAQEHSRRVSA